MPKIAATKAAWIRDDWNWSVCEPNNTFASQVAADWKHVLVTLTTAICDAVHAASPDTQFIGYGSQGSQVLDMLAMGGRVECGLSPV